MLLNVTEDHLDRYAKIQDYVDAKKRIFANQISEDTAVLNRDDPTVMMLSKQMLPKRTSEPEREADRGGFLRREADDAPAPWGGGGLPFEQARLKGIHNVGT